MSVSIEDVEIVETRIGANCRFLVSEMMGHCHAKELDFVCTAELVLKSRAPQRQIITALLDFDFAA